jgi:DNA polymerase
MTIESMKQEAVKILQDLKLILTYHSVAGIDAYPSGKDLDSFFTCRTSEPVRNVKPQQIDPVKQMPEKRAVHVERPVQVRVDRPAQVTKSITHTLHDLVSEVECCSRCNLSERRVVPVAGRGGEKVRLLVIGDWLAVPQGKQLPSGCLFGVEQDRMLGKMIDAIHLPRERVFVSNVIKCGIPDSVQPKAEHVHTCLTYLHRQIAILRPEVILSMGMIATRALLNRKEPLSRLRGRMHSYVGKDAQKINLIATYHPTYLLQNPEMKKATWFDLQMLEKHLGITKGQ